MQQLTVSAVFSVLVLILNQAQPGLFTAVKRGGNRDERAQPE